MAEGILQVTTNKWWRKRMSKIETYLNIQMLQAIKVAYINSKTQVWE